MCIIVPNDAVGHTLEWGTLDTIAELGFSGFLHEVTSDDVVIAPLEIFSEHRHNNICQ